MGIRNWFKRRLSGIVLWAIKDQLQRMTADFSGAAFAAGRKTAIDTQAAIGAGLENIRKQVASLAAVDIDFHQTGKIILVARIGEKHIVKIIDIREKVDLREYKRIVEELQECYGVRDIRVDGPPGYDDSRFPPPRTTRRPDPPSPFSK